MSYWIKNWRYDGVWILFPMLLPALAILLFPDFFTQQNETGPWLWLVLVVGIDVAHVYSTLFRTYFDSEFRKKHTSLFTLVPVLAWVIGILVYSIDGMLFWKLMAYLAVFHFIRQQYGFSRIYSRKEQRSLFQSRFDTLAIYTASLYPLLYWHIEPREFSWFLEGDFFSLQSLPTWPFTLLYGIIQLGYLGYSIYLWKRGLLNIPKVLLWLGTSLTWYIGIVAYNGDLSFSLTNILAHGIPYMALIRSQQRPLGTKLLNTGIGLVLICVIFAYLEEGIWNGIVWNAPEHQAFFLPFKALSSHSGFLLGILVPLLAVPQITHYVLDAYIWKKKYS